MNSLSWLIYFADVSGSLKQATGLWLAMGGTFVTVGLIAWRVFYTIDSNKVPEHWGRYFLAHLAVLFLCVVVSIAVPSSRTIYMIAASEAGETVVTSPEAKEMLDDLKSLIKRKMKEEIET